MIASFLVVVVVVAAAGDENSSEPLKATVGSRGAVVRGGPGEDFPASVELPAGASVEIYKVTPQRWCAIRPPRGSVSFLREDQLTKSGDRVAEVSVDGVASRLGDERRRPTDVYQVQLRRGEEVQLLAPRPIDGWWPIAPPSGEFRWVRQDDLTPPARRPAELARRGGADVMEPPPFAQDDLAPARELPPPPPESPEKSPLSQTPEGDWQSPELDFASELGAVELALAGTVCEPPAEWHLSELAHRARVVSRYADETIDRARARRLVDRIERFHEIQQGLLALNAAGAVRGSVAIAARPTDFAVTGALRRVPGPNGVASYALEDSFGRISYYLAGAADSELAPYVGRPLAVWGRRGYSNAAGAQVLQVDRIADAGAVVR